MCFVKEKIGLKKGKQDPVVSTVRYEVMKLCPGSVQGDNDWYLAVLSQHNAVLFGTLSP